MPTATACMSYRDFEMWGFMPVLPVQLADNKGLLLNFEGLPYSNLELVPGVRYGTTYLYTRDRD